jgi:hypothetical protein
MKINLLFLIAFLLAGCYYNKDQTLADVCSTTNVSYSNTITQIINANSCLTCHSGPTPLGTFTLENYTQVKAKATDMRGGISVLYGAVSHSAGFVAMPDNLPMLSTCEIAKIKAWIDAGAPQ